MRTLLKAALASALASWPWRVSAQPNDVAQSTPVPPQIAAPSAPSTPATQAPALRYQPWVGPSDPRELREQANLGRLPPDDRDELLFTRNVEHGGYGGPALKLSKVVGDPALLVGVEGGWLINHALAVGLAGYGLATRHDVPFATRVDGERSVLGFGYGGLRAAYSFAPYRLVHVGVGALLGAGGAVAVSRNAIETLDRYGDSQTKHHTAHADALFVLEPHAELELNVVRFMRIALSVSYRYVGAVDAPGMNSQKLSAPAGALTLKFGYF